MKGMTVFITALSLYCASAFVQLPSVSADPDNQAPQGLSSRTDSRAWLAGLPDMQVKEAFNSLKDSPSIVNDPLMGQAVQAAFGGRREEAMDLAFQVIRLPRKEYVEGRTVNRTKDFMVVKSILKTFPDTSTARLSNLYDSTNDAVTRGNIVLIVGGMSDDQRIQEILLKALEDKNPYSSDPEAAGTALRVCDLAYNQIMARYVMKDMLRTVGNGHGIEVRDQHIRKLKDSMIK